MAAMTLKEALDHAKQCKENGVVSTSGKALITLAAEIESRVATHADDLAVDRFAAMMKAKLAKSREKGRGGWDDPEQCSVSYLAKLLVDHVEKGDPVDVANLAMMIVLRGDEEGVLTEVMKDRLRTEWWKGNGHKV